MMGDLKKEEKYEKKKNFFHDEKRNSRVVVVRARRGFCAGQKFSFSCARWLGCVPSFCFLWNSAKNKALDALVAARVAEK